MISFLGTCFLWIWRMSWRPSWTLQNFSRILWIYDTSSQSFGKWESCCGKIMIFWPQSWVFFKTFIFHNIPDKVLLVEFSLDWYQNDRAYTIHSTRYRFIRNDAIFPVGDCFLYFPIFHYSGFLALLGRFFPKNKENLFLFNFSACLLHLSRGIW